MLRFFLPEPVSNAVKAEQIRLLFQQGVAIQLLGVVTAVISVAMLWNTVAHGLLGVWLAATAVVTLARLELSRRFHRLHSEDEAVVKWGGYYVAGTFVSGVVWGSLALFFESGWELPQQVFLFVIFTGIIAGAFNTNSSYFIAYPAFFLPVVSLLVFAMLTQSGETFTELALLFVVYILLMHISSLKFNERLSRSLEVRFDNERLATALTHSNEQLRELADNDALTTLSNRRSMDRFLSMEWDRHHRSRRPLSLLFIDIDFFKQFNDTYGHDGGDRCLKAVADILQRYSQRATDMAARFGGEEFAVILPETPNTAALKIAESIREEVHSLQIPHAASDASDYLTISVGVVTMEPDEPGHAERLRLAADKALYQAKALGRNQVVWGAQ